LFFLVAVLVFKCFLWFGVVCGVVLPVGMRIFCAVLSFFSSTRICLPSVWLFKGIVAEKFFCRSSLFSFRLRFLVFFLLLFFLLYFCISFLTLVFLFFYDPFIRTFPAFSLFFYSSFHLFFSFLKVVVREPSCPFPLVFSMIFYPAGLLSLFFECKTLFM